MRYITNSFFSLSLLLLCSFHAQAQLSAPKVESVYGGRIRAISSIPISADSSRIYITTESANSAFYADAFHKPSGEVEVGAFQVLPGLDHAAGYGAGIEKIGAHSTSRSLYFIHMGQLMSTHPSGTQVDSLSMAGVKGFLIEGDHLFYVQDDRLYFGDLDVNGAFTLDSSSPITLPGAPPQAELAIDPITELLHLFIPGNTPVLARFVDPYDSLSNATLIEDFSPSGLSNSFEWRNFGIAPDGRLFLAGSDFASKMIAYTDNDSTWTEYSSGIGGAPGHNLSFGGDSSAYHVYYASIYNDNQGKSGSWASFGQAGGFETHPNDGAVWADPLNDDAVYMTTDQGIGASADRGASIFEINTGVEAVKVKDFDMAGNKETAWLASKSGIRKVSTYRSTPSWTNAMFPTGDGSPYYAVAMAPNDTNTAYACNLRVYKTNNGGSNWQRLFSAEDPPYNFPSFGTPSSGAAYISTAEVMEADTSIVFVGYTIDGTGTGGLFYTHDGGTNWDQILLNAIINGQDADVNDIIFSIEGTDTVAYVGVEYDLSNPGARSVYRLLKNGATWTPNQEMNSGGTSTGSLIVATIRDLDISADGDTIMASGTDAGINHPIAYYKILSGTALWTPYTTSGFPFAAGKQGKAITLGIDTVYCAVDNEVYFLANGSSQWQLGYSYPTGTEINFIYFDELLVGTGTGLYGHLGTGTNATSIWKMKEAEVSLMHMYPNPANSQISLQFPNPNFDSYTLTIMTLSGQVVKEQKNIRVGEVQLQRSDFGPAGLYLVELKGKERFQGKLLIE